MVAARRPDTNAGLFARLNAAKNPAVIRHLRDAIVTSNMALVHMVARRYPNRGLDLDDLMQIGAIGLMTAIDKFDPSRELRFSTYAVHWIRHEITRALQNLGHTIRMPSYFLQLHGKVERARSSFEAERGRPPTPRELSHAAGVPMRRLRDLTEFYVDADMMRISLDCDLAESHVEGDE